MTGASPWWALMLGFLAAMGAAYLVELLAEFLERRKRK